MISYEFTASARETQGCMQYARLRPYGLRATSVAIVNSIRGRRSMIDDHRHPMYVQKLPQKTIYYIY